MNKLINRLFLSSDSKLKMDQFVKEKNHDKIKSRFELIFSLVHLTGQLTDYANVIHNRNLCNNRPEEKKKPEDHIVFSGLDTTFMRLIQVLESFDEELEGKLINFSFYELVAWNWENIIQRLGHHYDNPIPPENYFVPVESYLCITLPKILKVIDIETEKIIG